MHLFRFLLISLAISSVHSAFTKSAAALKSSCCECRSKFLKCPYCTYNINGHGCDLGISSSAIQSWYNDVRSVYNSYLSVNATTNNEFVPSPVRQYYFDTDGNGVANNVNPLSYTCSAVRSEFTYLCGSNATTDCFYTSQSSICDQPSDCVGFSSYAMNDGRYACISNCARNKGIAVLTDRTYTDDICYGSSGANAKQLLAWLRYPSAEACTNKITKVVDNDYYLDVTVQDTTAYNTVMTWLKDGNPLIPYIDNNNAANFFYATCTTEKYILDLMNFKKHLDNGWWGNVNVIYREPECTTYVPFSDKYDVCLSSLVGDQRPFLSCKDTLRWHIDIPTSLNNVIIKIKDPPPNNPGNGSTDCIPCANVIADKLDDVFGNFDPQITLNQSQLAKEQHEYAQIRAQETRSWWSDFWAFLTSSGLSWLPPAIKDILFDAIEYFMEQLVKTTAAIVLRILNTFLDLVKRSQEFINVITDYITKILDVLFTLVALILKILIGIFLQAEQHFLLFEYILLYVIINYKFLNNNVVSLIIVFIFIIIFGIQRNSPSILLYVYNVQYDFVDFSYYQSLDFNYTYHFYLHNRTNNSYTVGTVRLPKLSTVDIPKYNTSISETPRNFTKFNTSLSAISCNDFIKY